MAINLPNSTGGATSGSSLTSTDTSPVFIPSEITTASGVSISSNLGPSPMGEIDISVEGSFNGEFGFDPKKKVLAVWWHNEWNIMYNTSNPNQRILRRCSKQETK